jgi:hypothetical protein
MNRAGRAALTRLTINDPGKSRSKRDDLHLSWPYSWGARRTITWLSASRAILSAVVGPRNNRVHSPRSRRARMMRSASQMRPSRGLHARAGREAEDVVVILETLCAIDKARRGNVDGTFLP